MLNRDDPSIVRIVESMRPQWAGHATSIHTSDGGVLGNIHLKDRGDWR
jgi:hypothetical protein